MRDGKRERERRGEGGEGRGGEWREMKDRCKYF
jgi:hypothetical protein